MKFCPISLPLAIIEWQNLSRGFHDGYWCSDRIPFHEEEGLMEGIELTIQQYTSDRIDYFGTNVSAWQVLVRIFDSLTPDGRDYLCGGDFSSADNAKEYACYIAWQFKKGNRLASIPSELLD